MRKRLGKPIFVWIVVCILTILTSLTWADTPASRHGPKGEDDDHCRPFEECKQPEASGEYHDGLIWNGPGTCLECHAAEALEVHGSVHIQWEGDALFMTTGPARQGKSVGAVNSYCVNIMGNWGGCGTCHAGLGAEPEPTATQSQLENVDCLICHQEQYERVKLDGVFVPDTAKMSISMDEAVRTVHKPKRSNCLRCHAKGGGGDNYKRGDMALAHAGTNDRDFDVHMATSGENLACQDCHDTDRHLMAGRGSDLRVTENLAEIGCATSQCHTSRASLSGHSKREIGNHVARVACQTCHIPTYARNAADTAASEATEIHRTWLEPHPTASGAIHPANVMLNDLVPEYRFWNGTSWAYNLFETAQIDPTTGRYATSRPNGSIDDIDSKLYPFKYKTAEQPLATAQSLLIALDTSIYFATGDAITATEQGLANMGLSVAEPYAFIETDTYQLITHEVARESRALTCGACHNSTARMDLQGDLGYALKGPRSQICYQCHRGKETKSFYKIHEKHVKDKRYDCSWCHTFTRPERNLREP